MSINDILFDNSNDYKCLWVKIMCWVFNFLFVFGILILLCFLFTWYIKTILHYIYLLTKENKINDLNKRLTHSLLFPLPSLPPLDTSNHN